MAIALGAWLRWTEPQDAADLKPRPDALEYEEGARALARGDGYALVIDGDSYPLRYPPGLSLLIWAALPFTGSEPGVGVRVVFVTALIEILAAWVLGATAGGPLAGFVAAILVALSPLDAQWAQRVMSDVPSSAICAVVGAWSLLSLAGKSSRLQGLGVGFLAGLSVALRPSNVAIVLPLLVVPWIGLSARARQEGARRTVLIAIGLIVGLIPLGVYQLHRFGSPFESGYGLWRGAGFSWRFAVRPTLGADEFGNLEYYARLLLGFGDLYTWPVACLIALGAVAGWRRSASGRRLVAFSALFVLALLVIHVPFFWQWNRFLLPALPFLAATAAQSFGPNATWRVIVPSCALLALTIGLAAAPTQAWRLPEDTRLETSNLREIDALIDSDAVLIVRSNPFLFRAILRHELPEERAPRDRQWVPLGPSEHIERIVDFGISPIDSKPPKGWIRDVLPSPFKVDEAERQIARLLEERRPVYFATSPRDHQVAFASELKTLLKTRFDATVVPSGKEYSLYRVRATTPGAHSQPEPAPATDRSVETLESGHK